MNRPDARHCGRQFLCRAIEVPRADMAAARVTLSLISGSDLLQTNFNHLTPIKWQGIWHPRYPWDEILGSQLGEHPTQEKKACSIRRK